MTRKIKKYTNPFLKANDQLPPTVTSKLPSLQEAFAFHQKGLLDQAQKIYQSILTLEPRNANAQLIHVTRRNPFTVHGQ